MGNIQALPVGPDTAYAVLYGSTHFVVCGNGAGEIRVVPIYNDQILRTLCAELSASATLTTMKVPRPDWSIAESHDVCVNLQEPELPRWVCKLLLRFWHYDASASGSVQYPEESEVHLQLQSFMAEGDGWIVHGSAGYNARTQTWYTYNIREEEREPSK